MKGNLKVENINKTVELEVSRETNRWGHGMIALTSLTDKYDYLMIHVDRSDMERIITALQQTIKTLGDN